LSNDRFVPIDQSSSLAQQKRQEEIVKNARNNNKHQGTQQPKQCGRQ